MEQQKVRVDITNAPWMECSEKNRVFETKLLFKRLSPLISPSGREEHIPIEAVICSKCGKIPKFFYDKAKDVPEDLKSSCTF